MNPDSPYYSKQVIRALVSKVEELAQALGRELTIMEVCGTHTHAIAAAGLRRLLPEGVRLISGPGCPVCVTPVSYLDHAIALAREPGVIVCTFGDLIRVPASEGSLELATAEAESAQACDVRIVYSPRDAVEVARENPEREVVFLGVGFETTVPGIVAALHEAEESGLANFSLLSGARLIEPPLRALVQDQEVEVDGFLLPGHVSVILGADFYRFLVDEYQIPSAIVGFTPVDVLGGVVEIQKQALAETPAVANLYKRVVSDQGNRRAKDLMQAYLQPCDSLWRGLGEIPASGLQLRPEYAHRDAAEIQVVLPEPREPKGCRCGDILKGKIAPPECPLFAKACLPEKPAGACMVSSEGTCAAWYRHERHLVGGGV